MEQTKPRKSTVVKRSVMIGGHKTSVSIEDSFWKSLKEIAGERNMTLSKLVGAIDSERATGANLSSAIRVHILDHYRGRLAAPAPDDETRSSSERATAIESWRN